PDLVSCQPVASTGHKAATALSGGSNADDDPPLLLGSIKYRKHSDAVMLKSSFPKRHLSLITVDRSEVALRFYDGEDSVTQGAASLCSDRRRND
ncbi:MAG TPA: hypothetical protein V6C98_04750, partial [Thermosynechococcaceae cyanobacterium]